MKQRVGILFVCMGNICRSPTAQGVFAHMVAAAGLEDRIHVDSAATHAYHPGKPPDARSQEAASHRGYDLSDQRARVVRKRDFQDFDYILGMDRDNVRVLRRQCPTGHRDKLQLFLAYASDLDEDEVPDPYFGGSNGFEEVLDMVELAAGGLLDHIRRNH